jgi:hypothetical protein
MMGVSMSGIAFRAECTWTPETLVFAALLWAWSDEKTLIERFTVARKIIINRYAEQPEPAGSYQAFIKILCRWTEPLRQALSTAFRQRMVQTLAAVWMVEGWLVFAVDGSRVDVPRTRKNEERYSPKSKLSRKAQKRRRAAKRRRTRQAMLERRANVPRIWLTMMWHVGSGLPWDWPFRQQRTRTFSRDARFCASRFAADGRRRVRRLRLLEYRVGRGPSLVGARRQQCEIAQTTWICSGIRGIGVPVAGPRGQKAIAAVGVADGRGNQRGS